MKDSKTLIIGIDEEKANNPDFVNYHTWVTETFEELPWFVSEDGTENLIYTPEEIENVQFVSNVHVINPSRWFAGYVNLHSADLSGMAHRPGR